MTPLVIYSICAKKSDFDNYFETKICNTPRLTSEVELESIRTDLKTEFSDPATSVSDQKRDEGQRRIICKLGVPSVSFVMLIKHVRQLFKKKTRTWLI